MGVEAKTWNKFITNHSFYQLICDLSAHLPIDEQGIPVYQGRVGREIDPDTAYQAARECAIIILGALKDTLGSLDWVERVVKAFGLVNCGEDFIDVDKVFAGFSDTLADVLEERGYRNQGRGDSSS